MENLQIFDRYFQFLSFEDFEMSGRGKKVTCLLSSSFLNFNFISSLKEMDPEFVAYLEGKGFSEADYRSWDLQRKDEWVDRYERHHATPGKNILL
jgi:hypothetical protein